MYKRQSIQAAKYEGRGDPKALEEMTRIWKDLGKIAAELSIDPNLDQDFWENRVSSTTLQNFISELIVVTQRGTSLPAEEIQRFR